MNKRFIILCVACAIYSLVMIGVYFHISGLGCNDIYGIQKYNGTILNYCNSEYLKDYQNYINYCKTIELPVINASKNS
jgi:hypothetical protein